LALENGEYERTQGVYQFKDKKQSVSPEKKVAPLAPSLSLEKKKISLEKTKISSVGREERSPIW
jgi:hypothetical protein